MGYFSDAELAALARSATDLSQAKRAHLAILRSSRSSTSLFLKNHLVDMYAKCGSLHDAKAVFDSIYAPNLHSWNILLAAYAANGHLFYTKRVFDGMVQRDVVTWTTMVKAYSESGFLDMARLMFERMPQRNAVSWNVVITAYAQSGHMEEAETLFKMIPQRNVVTWTTMVAGYAQNGNLPKARYTFDMAPVKNLVTWNTMVAAYAQCGQIEHARQVFDSIVDRDEISWTIMIQAYSLLGYVDEAVRFFHRMTSRDRVAWTTMVQVYAQNGYYGEAKWVFDSMPNRDVVAWTYLIQVYGQNKGHAVAKELFDSAPVRNLVTWNAMIQCYAQVGHGTVLLPFMILEGFDPDQVTFSIVLGTCSHSGSLATSRSVFLSMVADHGVCVELEHYRCMIDTVGRSGDSRNARELVESMPYKADSFAWTILLGACNVSGDPVQELQFFLNECPPDNVLARSELHYQKSACAAQGQDHGIRFEVYNDTMGYLQMILNHAITNASLYFIRERIKRDIVKGVCSSPLMPSPRGFLWPAGEIKWLQEFYKCQSESLMLASLLFHAGTLFLRLL
ncbi:pentatricopeptide repeat-containing protein At4g02750-like [Selaginella moellendorffii]|uniref:pentatricopeptide repeat-containing protein At4g02750-like n=1 Tax=Selaginella moellendorffii TaxID=88036 RepID=UPI000D1C3563|nr:pentatricopeptide repeat-containing protein At4g02750-like [Selaginella moellendorffii]|eukprot:XP_024523765.1 pentatricopeptide repeat-containing protein At4g02750-like [Selaginella moellendorffii]